MLLLIEAQTLNISLRIFLETDTLSSFMRARTSFMVRVPLLSLSAPSNRSFSQRSLTTERLAPTESEGGGREGGRDGGREGEGKGREGGRGGGRERGRGGKVGEGEGGKVGEGGRERGEGGREGGRGNGREGGREGGREEEGRGGRGKEEGKGEVKYCIYNVTS